MNAQHESDVIRRAIAVSVMMFSVLFYACGNNQATLSESGSGGGGGQPAGVTSSVKQTSCPEAGAYNVSMQNSAFIPLYLTVPVNATVKWTNYDSSIIHHVTSINMPADSSFSSSGLSGGESVCYTFTKPGAYDYHCSDHMFARVIVE